MRTIVCFLAMTAIVCIQGGCADPSAPMVATKIATITPPHECLSSDPAWTNPPDADELRSDTARRERANKDKFNSMKNDRSVCRAGLKAIQKSNQG